MSDFLGYKKGGLQRKGGSGKFSESDQKYIISKRSGDPVDPEAQYFVLRVDRDPHAFVALQAYAGSVRSDNEELANDIMEWSKELAPFQKAPVSVHRGKLVLAAKMIEELGQELDYTSCTDFDTGWLEGLSEGEKKALLLEYSNWAQFPDEPVVERWEHVDVVSFCDFLAETLIS